jgi:hypothetical protein
MLIRQNHRGDRLALVHVPHPSSSSVVGVVRHHDGRSQLCVSTSLEDLHHTYSCTWCYYSKKKMETKRKALLAEEIGNLYSNSNIFVFCKRERCKNQHHLQTKVWEKLTQGYSHISPTLGVCIARQYNSSVRSSSFLVILSLHELPWCCSWCSSHVFRHCLSIGPFNLHLNVSDRKYLKDD